MAPPPVSGVCSVTMVGGGGGGGGGGGINRSAVILVQKNERERININKKMVNK